ncbi:MAG TPA: redoxin domain-containing protein [Bacteroidia bacterium]|nr:redoxin domain-containing protein [Bacteroidia bacterium]HNT79397.1 redoxin domain-containing protein [Bacteroidia bacterium]
MKRFVFVILILYMFLSCSTGNEKLTDISEIYLNTLNGDIKKYSSIIDGKGTVFVFLSPDCPLCENYSVVLKELDSLYRIYGINFFGVASGTLYKPEEYSRFFEEYDWSIKLLLDDSLFLLKHFQAKVSPEVVLLDSVGITIYQGAIDDWPVDLAKKRSIVTKHYLQDALKAYQRGEAIQVKKTEAIGCILEAR